MADTSKNIREEKPLGKEEESPAGKVLDTLREKGRLAPGRHEPQEELLRFMSDREHADEAIRRISMSTGDRLVDLYRNGLNEVENKLAGIDTFYEDTMLVGIENEPADRQRRMAFSQIGMDLPGLSPGQLSAPEIIDVINTPQASSPRGREVESNLSDLPREYFPLIENTDSIDPLALDYVKTVRGIGEITPDVALNGMDYYLSRQRIVNEAQEEEPTEVEDEEITDEDEASVSYSPSIDMKNPSGSFPPRLLDMERWRGLEMRYGPGAIQFFPKEITEEINRSERRSRTIAAGSVVAGLLREIGIDPEELRRNGQMDTLLSRGKTDRLVNAKINIGGEEIRFKTKVALNEREDGSPFLTIHPKRDLEESLDHGFMGHRFTQDERGNLRALGCAGHTISVKNANGIPQEFLVGLDTLTDEVIAVRRDHVNIPDGFGEATLTETNRERLRNGESVFMEGIKAGGTKCSGLVQYNVEKRRLELLPHGLSVSAIRNVKLEREQQELLKEGKTVLVSGLVDGQDQRYNAWVRLDLKNRRLMSTRVIPEKRVETKREITPANENKTQVNRNTKGFRKEENKFSEKPLLSGKQGVSPTPRQDDKARGKSHKM